MDLEHTAIVTFVLEKGLSVIAAIVILVAGWVVAEWAKRGMDRVLDRPRFDATLRPLLASLVRYLILLLTLLAVLDRFGVQTASFIAMLGAAGLAIGLALQGTLSNVAASVMLLLSRPYRVGEVVTINGQTGAVREISLFHTTLLTSNMNYVIIPNAMVFSGMIVNITREPTRRIEFNVFIDYAADVEKAMQVAQQVLETEPRVLKVPPPVAAVGGIGEETVSIIVRASVRNADYDQTLFDLQKAVKQAFDRAKIPGKRLAPVA